MMYDENTKCWENGNFLYGMCCVEYERYKALLSTHAKSWTDVKPDFCFTHSHEVHIRGSGIGSSYYVVFDGEKEPIDITRIISRRIQVKPTIPITHPAFKYKNSAETDLRKTFARVRREQREAAQLEREQKVVTIKRKEHA